MWQDDGRLWVDVIDTRSGTSFLVHVREPERALDVFHHPYAYAAHYGIDTQGSLEDWLPATVALV
jgi:hypothetical protein